MNIKKIVETAAMAAIFGLFLLFTDPNKISLPLILIPYLLAALIIYRVLSFGLKTLLGSSLSSSKLKLYSLILTAVVINFALLKSIGQITLQDGLISAAIVIVSVIYISRFSLDG